MTFYTKFHSPDLTMLHIKFGFNWPSGFRDVLNIMVIYIYIALGQGQTTHRGQIYFHKHKSSVHLHTPSKFPPHLITFFPFVHTCDISRSRRVFPILGFLTRLSPAQPSRPQISRFQYLPILIFRQCSIFNIAVI